MEDTNVFELTDEQLEMVTGGAGAETQSLAALPVFFHNPLDASFSLKELKEFFPWLFHKPIQA
jgi:hypothetical protein